MFSPQAVSTLELLADATTPNPTPGRPTVAKAAEHQRSPSTSSAHAPSSYPVQKGQRSSSTSDMFVHQSLHKSAHAPTTATSVSVDRGLFSPPTAATTAPATMTHPPSSHIDKYRGVTGAAGGSAHSFSFGDVSHNTSSDAAASSAAAAFEEHADALLRGRPTVGPKEAFPSSSAGHGSASYSAHVDHRHPADVPAAHHDQDVTKRGVTTTLRSPPRPATQQKASAPATTSLADFQSPQQPQKSPLPGETLRDRVATAAASAVTAAAPISVHHQHDTSASLQSPSAMFDRPYFKPKSPAGNSGHASMTSGHASMTSGQATTTATTPTTTSFASPTVPSASSHLMASAERSSARVSRSPSPSPSAQIASAAAAALSSASARYLTSRSSALPSLGLSPGSPDEPAFSDGASPALASDVQQRTSDQAQHSFSSPTTHVAESPTSTSTAKKAKSLREFFGAEQDASPSIAPAPSATPTTDSANPKKAASLSPSPAPSSLAEYAAVSPPTPAANVNGSGMSGGRNGSTGRFSGRRASSPSPASTVAAPLVNSMTASSSTGAANAPAHFDSFGRASSTAAVSGSVSRGASLSLSPQGVRQSTTAFNPPQVHDTLHQDQSVMLSPETPAAAPRIPSPHAADISDGLPPQPHRRSSLPERTWEPTPEKQLSPGLFSPDSQAHHHSDAHARGYADGGYTEEIRDDGHQPAHRTSPFSRKASLASTAAPQMTSPDRDDLLSGGDEQYDSPFSRGRSAIGPAQLSALADASPSPAQRQPWSPQSTDRQHMTDRNSVSLSSRGESVSQQRADEGRRAGRGYSESTVFDRADSEFSSPTVGRPSTGPGADLQSTPSPRSAAMKVELRRSLAAAKSPVAVADADDNDHAAFLEGLSRELLDLNEQHKHLTEAHKQLQLESSEVTVRCQVAEDSLAECSAELTYEKSRVSKLAQESEENREQAEHWESVAETIKKREVTLVEDLAMLREKYTALQGQHETLSQQVELAVREKAVEATARLAAEAELERTKREAAVEIAGLIEMKAILELDLESARERFQRTESSVAERERCSGEIQRKAVMSESRTKEQCSVLQERISALEGQSKQQTEEIRRKMARIVAAEKERDQAVIALSQSQTETVKLEAKYASLEELIERLALSAAKKLNTVATATPTPASGPTNDASAAMTAVGDDGGQGKTKRKSSKSAAAPKAAFVPAYFTVEVSPDGPDRRRAQQSSRSRRSAEKAFSGDSESASTSSSLSWSESDDDVPSPAPEETSALLLSDTDQSTLPPSSPLPRKQHHNHSKKKSRRAADLTHERNNHSDSVEFGNARSGRERASSSMTPPGRSGRQRSPAAPHPTTEVSAPMPTRRSLSASPTPEECRRSFMPAKRSLSTSPTPEECRRGRSLSVCSYTDNDGGPPRALDDTAVGGIGGRADHRDGDRDHEASFDSPVFHSRRRGRSSSVGQHADRHAKSTSRSLESAYIDHGMRSVSRQTTSDKFKGRHQRSRSADVFGSAGAATTTTSTHRSQSPRPDVSSASLSKSKKEKDSLREKQTKGSGSSIRGRSASTSRSSVVHSKTRTAPSPGVSAHGSGAFAFAVPPTVGYAVAGANPKAQLKAISSVISTLTSVASESLATAQQAADEAAKVQAQLPETTHMLALAKASLKSVEKEKHMVDKKLTQYEVAAAQASAELCAIRETATQLRDREAAAVEAARSLTAELESLKFTADEAMTAKSSADDKIKELSANLTAAEEALRAAVDEKEQACTDLATAAGKALKLDQDVRRLQATLEESEVRRKKREKEAAEMTVQLQKLQRASRVATTATRSRANAGEDDAKRANATSAKLAAVCARFDESICSFLASVGVPNETLRLQSNEDAPLSSSAARKAPVTRTLDFGGSPPMHHSEPSPATPAASASSVSLLTAWSADHFLSDTTAPSDVVGKPSRASASTALTQRMEHLSKTMVSIAALVKRSESALADVQRLEEDKEELEQLVEELEGEVRLWKEFGEEAIVQEEEIQRSKKKPLRPRPRSTSSGRRSVETHVPNSVKSTNIASEDVRSVHARQQPLSRAAGEGPRVVEESRRSSAQSEQAAPTTTLRSNDAKPKSIVDQVYSESLRAADRSPKTNLQRSAHHQRDMSRRQGDNHCSPPSSKQAPRSPSTAVNHSAGTRTPESQLRRKSRQSSTERQLSGAGNAEAVNESQELSERRRRALLLAVEEATPSPLTSAPSASPPSSTVRRGRSKPRRDDDDHHHYHHDQNHENAKAVSEGRSGDQTSMIEVSAMSEQGTSPPRRVSMERPSVHHGQQHGSRRAGERGEKEPAEVEDINDDLDIAVMYESSPGEHLSSERMADERPRRRSQGGGGCPPGMSTTMYDELLGMTRANDNARRPSSRGALPPRHPGSRQHSLDVELSPL